LTIYAITIIGMVVIIIILTLGQCIENKVSFVYLLA